MKREEILPFKGKRVKLVCLYPNETIILRGKLLEVNEETVLLYDFRTKSDVLIDLSVVKEVWKLE